VEKHHIVFKSQGGLDFPLNFKMLSSEEHRGNKGPHLCKKTDLSFKLELENTLFKILGNLFYTEDELIDELQLKPTQAHKICKKFTVYKEGYKREDVIRRLLGGKIY